jgi:SNF2-related domain
MASRHSDSTGPLLDDRESTSALIRDSALQVARTGPTRGAMNGPPAPKFRIGDRVRLRSDPTRLGWILSQPRPYGGGWEYRVGVDGSEEWFHESDLQVVVGEGQPRWESHEAFLRDLLLTKLRQPLADSLYTYRASRTVFEPYQFRPVLKFLGNPDQRILIADEVGLGKTIEAAIIYLELKARLNHQMARVLVLCPSRLKKKWQDELRSRFDEDFEDLDAPAMRTLLRRWDRLGTRLTFRAIASFETLRSQRFSEELLDRGIPLDLLIVDEAHHMRNAETRTYDLGALLSNYADAVVFLTATPLHLGNENLYNLLHLLASGDFNDPRLFNDLISPNTHINQASRYLLAGDVGEAVRELRRVERLPNPVLRDQFTKNPLYHEVVERLQALQAPGDVRDRLSEVVSLQRDLLELNTLSRVFSRTRKREVADAAMRRPTTLRVRLSPPEREFYDALLRRVRRDLASARGGAPSFAVIMRERMAASCLAATRATLEEARRAQASVALDVERSAFDLGEDDPAESERFERIANDGQLLALSRRIGSTDAKFDLWVVC